MIIVVPFNVKDSALAAQMLHWCADLCGQQDRTCILAHEELTPAHDVQRAASRAFRTVEHLHVSAAQDAWPIAANCYFAKVAAEMRGRAPWAWLEGDCTPTSPDTFDRLEQDYQRAGRGCLGTIIPAFFYKNGTWTQVGEMLCGVAIYHPNLWDHSPLLRALRATQTAYAAWNRANPGKPTVPKAFDCYLSPEILPASGATSLIQHMGRSKEFRRENGRIVCTYGAESRWSSVVSPEAALIHGCKDGSLIALLRAEMAIPVGRTIAAPAAVIATPARREPKSTEWGAEAALPKEKAPNAPPPRPGGDASAARPAPPIVVDKEAFATLGDAKAAIQHWPGCTNHLLTLQEGRGRYRVGCQCGACSPKLPQGPDWERTWNDHAAIPGAKSDVMPATQVIEEAHLLRRIDERLRPAASFEEMVNAITPSLAEKTAEFANTEGQKTLDRIASNQVIVNPGPVPITQLRYKRDIIANYPELGKLTMKAFSRRVNQLKLAERRLMAKPQMKELAKKTERILTAPARLRKLELLNIGRGRQGAFLKLRNAAVKVGVKGTSGLKKDQLIIAILEREFEQPYEDFAEASA